MIRQPVVSSNVVSAGYSAGLMEVEFATGVYRYSGVPEDVYGAFLASNSKGRFVQTHLKDVYPFEKVATPSVNTIVQG
jgi:hypothetical protein